MDICLYYCFFLLVSIEVFSILVDSSPEISARKHVFFPDFSLHNNSKILHDLKLLGSAKLSNEKGVIQIPDDSQATDLRHQAGRAIYSSPVRLLDPVTKTPTSFETTFSFQFNTSNSTRTSRDGGSSLTIIIVPDEFTVGRAGHGLACSTMPTRMITKLLLLSLTRVMILNLEAQMITTWVSIWEALFPPELLMLLTLEYFSMMVLFIELGLPMTVRAVGWT
ncbi:hypothetical protein AB3S75_023026 [Citrus x aurantiifolia]